MYIQGQNESPMAFLRRVHGQMAQKYMAGQQFMGGGINIEAEKLKAQKLQEFLSNLKMYAETGATVSPVGSAVVANILDKVNATYKAPVKKLFQRGGGLNFEQELGKVITAAYQEANIQLDDQALQQLVVGQVRGTAPVNFEPIVKQFAEQIHRPIQKVMSEAQQINAGLVPGAEGTFKMTGVEQKIDVQGANMTLSFENGTDPYLQEIVSILNEATISAKNYSSDEEVIADLKLGSSHPVRSIGSALSSLGYGDNIINEFFVDMTKGWSYYSRKPEFKEYLFGLQFMYELTGANTTSQIGGAKYLIYNKPSDPFQPIYVQSTAVLMQKVLEHPEHWMPANYDPFKHYTISVGRKMSFWTS